MAGEKAIPFNLVAGDKGQKSVNVGIAFQSNSGKVPWSMTLSLTKLRAAIEKKVVTTRKEEASKTQYPNPFEGDETVRIVGFEKTKRSAI